MSEFVALRNIMDPNIPTSSGQHVLMKDQSKIKKSLRRTTIVVNSRDRDYIKCPNSNTFKYEFRRPLKEVLTIELMNGCIPAFIYNVNLGWNTFSFLEDGIISKVILRPGFYNEATLLTELQEQLNSIPVAKNTYTVVLNPITKRISISTNNVAPYGFLFYSGDTSDYIDLNTVSILEINTPARQLGFGLNNYYSDASGNLNGLLPMDINNFINRMYLHIEADGKNLSRMELGSGRPDCFHIFYLTPGQTDYIMLDKETDHSMFESSPATISRIMTFEISLRDEFNRPMDINYREFSLVFEITHLE
jgi:hypothetical protein